ncbi:hypothetical protein [Roseomonas sp. BN140053]|uniref:hypothetical protein n=1 Tax=Roseomonas sp. BN140053 TaxID=3391898 RepID=UPI0039E7D7F0
MNASLTRRLLLAAAMSGLTSGIAAAQGNDPSFYLRNGGTETIQEAYVSSSQVSTWGQDRLGANVLASGLAIRIELPAGQCENDLRVVYNGGRSEERRNINTCQMQEVVFGNAPAAAGSSGKGGPAAASQQGNPSFNVVNNGRDAIVVVRASLTTEQSWGEDRLGANTVIAPGQTQAIRLPQGACNYDVRFEFQGGRAEERRNLDLCAISSLTVP